MDKTRIRIHFTKTGDLRWISHRDLARTWERLLRRAGLQLAFSEGFHPKPKISFPSALALGIVALDEIVEMDLLGSVDMDAARASIEQHMPDGMALLSVVVLPGREKAAILAASYEIELEEADAARAREQIELQRAAGIVEVMREGKLLTAQFGQPWFDIACDGKVLRFTLPTTAQGSLRPSELLEALSIAHVLPQGGVLTRTRVHLTNSANDQVANGPTQTVAATTNQST